MAVKEANLEDNRVFDMKWKRAAEVGLDPKRAFKFAQLHGDITLLERLVKAGCDPLTAFEIAT